MIWENFGIDKKARFWRKIVYFFWVILILIICFYSITNLEKVCQDSDRLVLSVICSAVTEQQAITDYSLNDKDRNGDYHCYCKNQYEDPATVDLDVICTEWYDGYIKTSIMSLVIPVIMCILCVSYELLIKLGSEHLTRPTSHTAIVIEMVNGISCLQYINLALIYPMIFMRMQFLNFRNPPGVLQGKYSQID
jgi:hypothetical protein